MEANRDTIRLDYNTEREKLNMPEYGRNVSKMVEKLFEIEDREQRSQQAAAIVKVMEILNPQVHNQENYEQKLWDHLYMIAGGQLDIDAPYPAPDEKEFNSRPVPIPMKGSRIKATHYGRNIETIINLLCEQPDSDIKTETIRALAIYMRQQYLIWNKDSVADETIFSDIEKLSGFRLKVPEGITLNKLASDAQFARPSMGIKGASQQGANKNRNNRKSGWNRGGKKK